MAITVARIYNHIMPYMVKRHPDASPNYKESFLYGSLVCNGIESFCFISMQDEPKFKNFVVVKPSYLEFRVGTLLPENVTSDELYIRFLSRGFDNNDRFQVDYDLDAPYDSFEDAIEAESNLIMLGAYERYPEMEQRKEEPVIHISTRPLGWVAQEQNLQKKIKKSKKGKK